MSGVLQSRFEEQVDRTPGGTAVSGPSGRLTYRELDIRANRLANYLRGLGVGRESLVTVYIPRDLDLVVAIVAITKAGGAYVPLDPEHPRDRLAFYVSDCGARVLLTVSALSLEVPAETTGVRMDTDAEAISRESSDRVPSAAAPEDLAYVIYTSGSTGVPKGAMVTNRNVVRLFDATNHWFGFAPGDVWTMFHSAAFDFSVWEMWGALLYGGRLTVIPFAVSRDASAVARLICTERVTVLNQTPSAFRQVGRALMESRADHALRFVIFGGEALDFTSLRPWAARFGVEQPQLINMYGITETTVHTTYRRLSLEDIEQATGSLIGLSIPDLGIRVLNEDLRPVDTGETGEIFVSGEGVARGYLNRPELTAARFPTLEGIRLYKSGDLARPLANGDLEYLGRIDDQVKIRGFRIELGEIASRLGRHAAIRDAAVIAVGAAGEAKLVAYCVPRESSPAPAELRRFLFSQVPDYMVPSAFVFVDALPLTVNGKLDRKALPAPEEEPTPFRKPESAVELAIAHIWEQVLGVERVGRDDNFIALGGQSLQAMEAISRIASECRREVSFGEFFASPTLADLGRRVLAGKAAQAAAPPVPVPRDRPLPASAAQQRLSLHWRLNPRDVAYNETLTVCIPETVDAEAMRRALEAVGLRHESLRTTFVDLGGELAQFILPAPSVSLAIMELPGEEEAIRAAEELACIPFDLNRGPLWRCLLVRLDTGGSRLYVTIHHIVWDASSEPVFVGELERFYRSSSQELPPLAFQCADVAVWERSRTSEARIDSQLEYWKEKLSGELPILALPSSLTRTDNPSPAGARQPLRIDPSLSAALKDLARREGATLFHVLLSAMNTLFYRYTGGRDLTIGSVVNDRKAAGMDALIGYFVSPVVNRTRIEDGFSFRELLSQVREASHEAHTHSDVSLERLIEVLKPERRAGVHPLFQAVLGLGPRLSQPGSWTWRHYDVFSGCAKFDISFLLEDTPEGIAGKIEYKTDIVDTDLARRMAGHFVVLLEAVVANPSRRLDSFPLLTEAESSQFREWNSGTVHFDESQCAHDVFEAVARRFPDLPAVVFGSRSLTYKALDRRANQLAHCLRSMGAGPDVLIGMCCDRSPEALIAFLGILKSGAAYVPLDPTNPDNRLAFMIEDSAAPVVVTQKHLTGKLTRSGGRLFVFEDEAETLDSQPDACPNSGVRPENLAYAIYTSGSTGKPKGVLVEHRNLVNCLHTATSPYPIPTGARVLQFSRFSFDASIMEIGLALSSGGTLVMAPQATLLGGRELTSLIRERRVEFGLFPPSLLALMDEAEVPSLRTVWSVGEPCPAAVVERWAKNRLFFNGYGPTEITICSSMAVCRAGEGKPSIGTPRPNTDQWVLDAGGHPLPVGVPGELCIGGKGVARGYHNRPELTAERFVRNPFSADPNARLYRSGDLVRWLPDGTLDCLGRIDNQIKLRGFRIEPGEIEAALRQHSAVADAAVLVREDSPGDKRLAAYVVLRHPLEDGALRAHLTGMLPEYMTPSAFVFLEKLPVSPSGKVDRKALPAPFPVTPPSVPAVSATPVGGHVLDAVTAIWGEILGLAQVPADVPFFDLGGHSLSLARVQAAIHDRLKVNVGIVSLFRYQTARALAEHLGTLAGIAVTTAAPSQPVQIIDEVPAEPELRKSGIAVVGFASGKSIDGCALAALDDAGHDPLRHSAEIGLFGAAILQDIAVKLSLRGPVMKVEAGAASGLAAVHAARLSLLAGDCDLALAGSETGIVALRRMEDAIADGDAVGAVIRASSIANDGAGAGGEGLKKAALQSYRKAGVNPASIGMAVVDSDFLPALVRAFRRSTQKREFCVMHSAGPGVDAVVQAVSAFEAESIPAATGTAPAGSPFYAASGPVPWKRGRSPRRADVSASGAGNHVHMLLEEASAAKRERLPRPAELLCLSAADRADLERKRHSLTEFLRVHPDLSLSDIAFTLQVGRSELSERSALVSTGEPVELESEWMTTPQNLPSMVFVPDSEGRISWELYAAIPGYRAEIGRVAALARADQGGDIRNLLLLVEQHPTLAVFVANWSLGRTLMALTGAPWQIAASGPAVLAACTLAGVLTLKEAILVAMADDVSAQFRRARLTAPDVALLTADGSSVTRQQAQDPNYWIAALALPAPTHPIQISSSPDLFTWLGRRWTAGGSVDWQLLYPSGSVGRVRLPSPVLAGVASPAAPSQSTGRRAEMLAALARREDELFAAQSVRSVDDYPGLRLRMEAYCASRVYDLLLREAGVTPETMIRSGQLFQRMKVIETWLPFAESLLGILAKAGDATVLDGRVRFRSAASDRAERIAREILRDCPEGKVLVELVDAAISSLPSVMRGSARMPESVAMAWNAAAEWRAESALATLASEAAPLFGEDSVRVGRTRAETWERLAIGIEPVMTFTQWTSDAQESGFTSVETFPRSPERRAATSLGLFLRFKGDE